MISLVDSTHEYILAESTRTLSPQDDDVHDAGDSLWLGVRTIPREESLCAAVINTPRSKGKRNDTESRPKVIPKVINDLADDETLMYDRNIIGGPKIRFVATVPIRSRLGYDIGAYSVFDDVPRNGLIIEELEFLTDIADTVMEHLENITVKRDHQRGEKMVKGLGLFVEGHSSIKSWWLRTRHNRQTSVRGDHPYAARSVENAINRTDASDAASDKASIEANLSYVEETQELDVPMSQIPAPTPLLTINAGMPIKLQREDDQPFDHSSSRVKGDLPRSKETIDRSTALAPVGNAAKLPVSVPSEHPKPAPTVPSETHLPIINKNDQSGETPTRNRSPNVTEDLRKMLSRASNLIRESTDVEGVVFFDAKTSGFGSRGRQTFIKPERASHLHDAARTSSSDDDPRTSLRNETSDSSNGKRLHKESKEVIESSQPSLCEVMAYSTASKCSLCGDQSMPEHLTVTENFVRRLFKQHPHGKIYAFDDEGNMSSSEDELHDAAPEGEMAVIAETPQSPSIKKASSRISEGQTMMQIFPGARYVMILPLWDSQRERWFASTMLWTSDPTRVLSLDDDLNYVAAFGNSIMAEVSRLDIVASDQKKTALISSISHELRSPLHGIASGIELLQDTQINKYQMDVVNTIGHCSTTLLDTLNNVLDYAKINNFTTAQKTEERAIHNSSRAREAVPSEKFRIYGTISLTSNLDIACITEDVINGIYAGHVYALQSTSPVSADIDYPISPTKLDTYITQEMLPLSVILEVEHKSNWTFLTQPGAWKRIIMNIFGNALKFTSSGLVKVSMSYKNATSSKSRMNQAFVTLTISDTGRGIDADFLKHQIYSPFAQEDSLTPGAGLGLSIVRQIVGALDGKIEVHSVQNIGTVVKVVLKLEKSQSPTDGKPLVPSTIQQARTYTQGLELVLIGLELSTPEPEETADLRAKRRDSVGPTIARLSKNWFGMKTSEAAGFEKSIGDVFLITSERFYELEDSWKSLYAEALSNSRKKHVIVLTGSAQSERKTLFENYQNIHFLSNPYVYPFSVESSVHIPSRCSRNLCKHTNSILELDQKS